MKIKFYIGYDVREREAFHVLCASLQRYNDGILMEGIVLSDMQDLGLMTRKYERRKGILYDVISDHPCSTEFSISRFLTLELARLDGVDYAVFMDSDMLVTCDMEQAVLNEVMKDNAPVWCVKHDHIPSEDTKMDGQVQSKYGMKNWSSFVVYNVNHPLNKALTLEEVNTRRGIELHQFCWLEDKELISPLPVDYNYLVGYYPKSSTIPRNIHYTEGIPTMAGYEGCNYATLWMNYYNEIYKRSTLS